MSISVSEIQSFSDADILKVLRKALVSASLAQGYSFEGRRLDRATPAELQGLIEKYERRVANQLAASRPMRRRRRTGGIRFVPPGG